LLHILVQLFTPGDLYNFNENGKLIENSNFVNPAELEDPNNKHKRYTFIKAKEIGTACSEPKNIKYIDILEEIDNMIKKRNDSEENYDFSKKNERFIFSLDNSIKETLEESDNYYQRAFKSVRSKIKNQMMN